MFFTLSKVLWWIAAPGNALLIVLGAGTLLLFTPWQRAGRWIVALATLTAVSVAVFPIGAHLAWSLENRFPASPPLPERIDGIISLGGVISMDITRDRGQTALGDPVERLTAFAALAEAYPQARLLFTGGTGRLDQGLREADFVAPFFDQIGLDPHRVIYDNQARNTFENAVLAKALLKPEPGQTWILVTSAAHMPRSIGCFRKVGWTGIIPYPVDFHTFATEPSGWIPSEFAFAERLNGLENMVHEWLGLLFYWLTDRTDTLFPEPEPTGS